MTLTEALMSVVIYAAVVAGMMGLLMMDRRPVRNEQEDE